MSSNSSPKGKGKGKSARAANAAGARHHGAGDNRAQDNGTRDADHDATAAMYTAEYYREQAARTPAAQPAADLPPQLRLALSMAELIMTAQDCIRGFLRAHVAASPRRQLLVPAQTAFYCMQLLLRDLATVAHANDAQMAQVRAATERLGHSSMCSGGSSWGYLLNNKKRRRDGDDSQAL